MIRIGQSTDIHRLKAGKPLILGGIEIDSLYGTIAHSDGDCLVHVITEAIIGALGLGDLGTHFPDDDDQYKNISSLVLLAKVCDMMKERHFEVINIDSLVIIEKPRIKPYINAMKQTISKVIGIDAGNVNIKATTGEGLGAIGKLEAIQCQAVVLLKEN